MNNDIPGKGRFMTQLKGKLYTILAAFVLMLFAVSLLPVPALAAETDFQPIAMDREVSLAVRFTENTAQKEDSVPIEGMEFRAYFLASSDAYRNLTTQEKYKGIQVDWPEDLTGYRKLAGTLKAYIESENIEPDDTVITDAQGIGLFAKVKEKGMYLILADDHKDEKSGRIYSIEPCITFLPFIVEESGEWNYNVIVTPKYSSRPVPDEDISINVRKVWKDTGMEADRPEKIVVQLKCKDTEAENAEYELHSEAELNKENNWRHTFKELDPSMSYTVTEKDVPEGYTVEITENGTSYVISNERKPGPTPTPTPTPPVTPPGNGKPTPLPQTGADKNLPKILLIAGAGLVAAGIIRKKSAGSK